MGGRVKLKSSGQYSSMMMYHELWWFRPFTLTRIEKRNTRQFYTDHWHGQDLVVTPVHVNSYRETEHQTVSH